MYIWLQNFINDYFKPREPSRLLVDEPEKQDDAPDSESGD